MAAILFGSVVVLCSLFMLWFVLFFVSARVVLPPIELASNVAIWVVVGLGGVAIFVSANRQLTTEFVSRPPHATWLMMCVCIAAMLFGAVVVTFTIFQVWAVLTFLPPWDLTPSVTFRMESWAMLELGGVAMIVFATRRMYRHTARIAEQ